MKTVSQLAQELNVNRTTLHRLIQCNNIETLHEGNKRLIDAQAEQLNRDKTIDFLKA